MGQYKVGRRDISGATSWDLSGRDTAVKSYSGLRTSMSYKNLGSVLRGSLLVAAFVLLPATRTFADFGGAGGVIVPQQVSTIPANGDLNPYGVAFIPKGFPGNGLLPPGGFVVSNFNAKSNAQGTGTTIVSVSPAGKTSLFFQGTAPLGLTTALGVLSNGFVIVGNLPTDQGGTPQQGSLLILDRNGAVVATLTNATLLDGPWDLTIQDDGATARVFVSCVLNGTVTRIDLLVGGQTVTVKHMVQIASGYGFGLSTAALVVGPTGLAFDAATDVLYVASTSDNEIFAVKGARVATHSKGTGTVVYNDSQHLHGPLGLALAPNGHLISTQGDAVNPSSDPAQQSEVVEFTTKGQFVGQFSLDSAAGAAFGIALVHANGKFPVDLGLVNDATNTLTVFEFGGD